MHHHLNMEVIFPIRDEPSAQLMGLKAECLYSVGVINERQKQAVLKKAADFSITSNRIVAIRQQIAA